MGECSSTRVLYAGDEGRATRLAEALERAGELSVRPATDVAEVVELLGAEEFDALLLDVDLPGAAPIELVELVRERQPDLPIVQIAADEAVAAAALEAGAADAAGPAAAERPDLLARRILAVVEREREREHDATDGAADPGSQAEFARLVAHDLRNPLAVARGWLDLLKETGDEEHYRKAVRALDRIDGIVDNLETLAGGAAEADGTEDRVELSAVATAAWELIDAPGSDLRVEYGHDLLADPSLLQQALQNLLANAVEHGPPDDAEGVTVRVGARPAEGVLYVADDGRGIPEEERERIFEAGYSGDGGTGFGLAIVERVAQAHGWSLGVRESEGGGARFEFGNVEFLEDGDNGGEAGTVRSQEPDDSADADETPGPRGSRETRATEESGPDGRGETPDADGDAHSGAPTPRQEESGPAAGPRDGD